MNSITSLPCRLLRGRWNLVHDLLLIESDTSISVLDNRAEKDGAGRNKLLAFSITEGK